MGTVKRRNQVAEKPKGKPRVSCDVAPNAYCEVFYLTSPYFERKNNTNKRYLRVYI